MAVSLGTNNLLLSSQTWSANGTNTTVSLDTTKFRSSPDSVKAVATAAGSTEHKTGYGFDGTGNDPVAGKPYATGVWVDDDGDLTYDIDFLVNFDTVDAAGVHTNVQRRLQGEVHSTDTFGKLWTADVGLAPDGTTQAQLIVIANENPAAGAKWFDDHYFGDPANLPPTANAGPDQSVTTGATVQLSGSGSDPEGAVLTFAWSLAKPANSTAILSSTTAANPTFVADIEGTYTATLTVSDGTNTSAPDSVDVLATKPPTKSVELEWTAPSGTITGYQLERQLSGSTTWTAAGAPTGSPYIDPDGADGASYRLRAVNGTLVGAWSNVAVAAAPVTG